MLQPLTITSLDNTFRALLAGVRAIRPKCPDCGQPLDQDETEVRVRKNDVGQDELVCRPCFTGEIAEMQMAHQPPAASS